MKYLVEYYLTKDVGLPRYNVYFKRHWWSRREVIAEGIDAQDGIIAVKDYWITPHLKKMCKVDFKNLHDSQYNMSNLKL